MKLENIIKNLSADDYNAIVDSFTKTKAEKFLKLLESINKKKSEAHIIKSLKVSPAAYYTLRSRLLDKIQEHVYSKAPNAGFKLSKNIDNIEHLLYNSPKEIALSVLLKLEKELKKFDLQSDLAIVYKAFCKLYALSDKYNHYHDCYLKAKEDALAIEKAEDLLHLFNKNCSIYWASRGVEQLNLIIKNKREMNASQTFVDSHHLKVFKNILNIQFALYIGLKEEMQEDDSIEQMLLETLEIINAFPDDKLYLHLGGIINLLHFEYYIHSKLYKKAGVYFEKIKSNWMGYCYYNRGFFVANFYASVIDYYFHEQQEKQLANDQLFFICEQDKDCLPDYIIAEYFKAINLFYAQNYTASLEAINKLLEEVSFKNYDCISLEIKFFQILLHLKNDNLLISEKYLKSMENRLQQINCKELKTISIVLFKVLHKYCFDKKNKKRSTTHFKKLIQKFELTNANQVYHFIRLRDVDFN